MQATKREWDEVARLVAEFQAEMARWRLFAERLGKALDARATGYEVRRGQQANCGWGGRCQSPGPRYHPPGSHSS